MNDFNQKWSGYNLVQSGNLIALGTGALTDTSGPHQVFATGVGSITMTQLGSGTNNLQTLNAIVDKVNGTLATQAHQTISTTGPFAMSQNAMTSSRQFGSFAGELK
ncbi:MAG: hypothetical protein A6F72_03070 [Cycloclasticus sp. symbiont of Poecilosclerida sp. N]|nr:MAG: hypothetical protein A6F72_03070 [Cycloclasticus sp. symbiont of Poecilosclerida sp. N]